MPKTGREFDQELGERIVEARRRQKLSRTKLAEQLGITAPMLLKHERGVSAISASRLVELSEILRIPPTSMLPTGQFSQGQQIILDTEERELVQSLRKLPQRLRRKALSLCLEIAQTLKSVQA